MDRAGEENYQHCFLYKLHPHLGLLTFDAQGMTNIVNKLEDIFRSSCFLQKCCHSCYCFIIPVSLVSILLLHFLLFLRMPTYLSACPELFMAICANEVVFLYTI